MKKSVILIMFLGIIFINLNFIHAINNPVQANITLDYPAQVNFAQEFNVNVALNNFPNDVYAVRIGVINDSIRLARIWNNSHWQSTYYYLNNIINTSQKNTESFRLNITNCYNGNAKIEVKLRDSKNYVYSFYNYSINVIGNCSVNHNNQTPANNTSNNSLNNTAFNPGISLNLDWDNSDIKNGKDFEIRVRAYNLEDKDYDIKIFIYNEDKNKPISQVYNDNKWVSSSTYLTEFFKGPGDKAEDVKLRIKENSMSFNGEANIGVRIREKGTSVYKKEIYATIDIIESDDKKSEDNNETATASSEAEDFNNADKSNNNESVSQYSVSEEVVHQLTAKAESIKSRKNTIYKSKNELIKEYSIYLFIALIFIFLGLLVFLKFGKK